MMSTSNPWATRLFKGVVTASILLPCVVLAGLDRERACDTAMVSDGKCKKGDVIFVYGFDIARFCDLHKNMVPLADKGGAAAVCFFVGYERKTRADYL